MLHLNRAQKQFSPVGPRTTGNTQGLSPDVDEAEIRKFLEAIHAQAARAFEGASQPGRLQLVRIHPLSEDAVAQRFRIGDVDAMTRAAVQDAAAGHNVYVEARTISESAPRKGRGRIEDTRGVFALVVDSDTDKKRAGKLSVRPSISVETSPENAHHWLFLEKALPPDEARALGDALRATTGADDDTGTITQPYRVAGTPNLPSRKKLARGRVPSPTKIMASDGPIWSANDLEAAFPARRKPERSAGSVAFTRVGVFTVEPLLADTTAADRSAQFQKAVNAAIRVGMTQDEFEALARTHPQGCACKYLEGRDRLREEIERSWAKGEQQQEVAAGEAEGDLARLNAKYCVVRDSGRTRVLAFEQQSQKEHRREVATFISFEDFRNYHLNRRIREGEKAVPLGHWWLKHPERRQYEGLTFQPGQPEEIDGKLNLWRGWGVPPRQGCWKLMRRHIIEVLAADDVEAADYIIRWVAWAFQHPAERAQAALVFKGKKGTGKGTLGNALCQIFGQHGTHISSAEHLAGRFNGHLRDACLLFADEAYWPGDKGAEGSLKRLITEPDLFIEAKGRDGITVPNMLHIIMASNEDWIVPAGEDERRYAVFTVSDCHKQDESWFQPLYAEVKAGGLAAMLYDLLRLDLGEWHPRQIPRTQGLLDQQSQGLRPEDAWWVELLQTGSLWGADPRQPNCAVSNSYEEEEHNNFGGTRTIKRRGLYDQAREVSPPLKRLSDHLLGGILAKHGCTNTRKVLRRRGWTFPPLAQARAEWEARFPGWTWQDPELQEWQAEP